MRRDDMGNIKRDTVFSGCSGQKGKVSDGTGAGVYCLDKERI